MVFSIRERTDNFRKKGVCRLYLATLKNAKQRNVYVRCLRMLFFYAKNDIEKHFKDQETARALAEKTQNRITCVICCDEKIELDFVACPEGHQICCDCVRK